MDRQLKERLTGAVVLVAAAVIVIPMVLSGPPEPEAPEAGSGSPASSATAPSREAGSGGSFSSRIVPLGSEQSTSPPTSESAPRRVARAPEPETAVAPKPKSKPKKKTAPTPAPAPARKKSTGTAPREGWVVQLGSFSNARNAVALRDKLRKAGYQAFVESAGSGADEVTRVFVGPESKRERSERAVGKLARLTGAARLVPRVPNVFGLLVSWSAV